MTLQDIAYNVDVPTVSESPDAVVVAGMYPRRVKRIIDVVGGVGLLLVFMPVILIVSALVRWQLGSGIFYRQQRVGLDGELFSIVKFRTMRHDRRQDRSGQVSIDRRSAHKAADDPRHTCLLYTSPSPRDRTRSRMPSSA